MSDIKLFRIGDDGVQELESTSVSVEKSLRSLIERHLEALLGVRFLASEYPTDKTDGRRMDTLGLDDRSRPVVVQYQRASDDNVISRGLFSLKWLMDHKVDLYRLVLERYGKDTSDEIDWDSPRLVCIAREFTEFDEHAFQHISCNIELIRYRRFDDLLLFDLVARTTGFGPFPLSREDTVAPGSEPAVTPVPSNASARMHDRYFALRSFLLTLGPNVRERLVRDYVAFRARKNFVTIRFRPRSDRILVYVNVSPDVVELEPGFTRDMRESAGYAGVWQLEITIDSDEDLERAKPLLIRSYEAS